MVALFIGAQEKNYQRRIENKATESLYFKPLFTLTSLLVNTNALQKVLLCLIRMKTEHSSTENS